MRAFACCILAVNNFLTKWLTISQASGTINQMVEEGQKENEAFTSKRVSVGAVHWSRLRLLHGWHCLANAGLVLSALGLRGAADYPAYHIAWWHSIWTVIFIPGGLVTAGAIAMLWLRPPGVPAWAIKASILLQFLIYGLTAVWWGRLMAEMEQVSGPIYGPLYHQLVLSHWLRVALVLQLEM